MFIKIEGGRRIKKSYFGLWSFLVVMAVVLMFAAGCATAPPGSGFLKDYSQMKTDPDDESLKWWEKKGVDWKRYKRLMIDPVLVYYNPEAKNRQIEPDVLRIRAAITDLIPANPLVNIITTAGACLPLDMGGASMEAMFLDPTTHELLGAVVDSKKGTPVDINGFTTWGHAKGAFEDWAELLKESLEYESKK